MFALREVTIPPGCELAYERADWRDALVLLGDGDIELEARSGDHLRLGPGDVFWLAGLPLRALRNRGPEPAVLVAVSRQG